jgi:hypothetical protein
VSDLSGAGVSRGEFDMLAHQVAALGVQLASLDMNGTRGTIAAVGVVQVQLSNLHGDVGSLTTRLDRHEDEHRRALEQAERDRVARSRYRVTSIIAGVSAIGGLYGILLYVASQLHLPAEMGAGPGEGKSVVRHKRHPPGPARSFLGL